MDREDFIQSSVRIRYAEKKLLTKQQLERLVDAKNLEETIKFLNETSYSSEIAKLDRIENYEKALSEVLNQTYKEVTEISPEDSLVEILKYKYLYHNLKVCIKENILKENFASMYCTLDENEIINFREKVFDSNEEISNYYKECLELFEKSNDPQDIDIFLDKKCFEKIIDLSIKFELNMVEEYFKSMVDFINIKTFIRCKKQNQLKDVLDKCLINGGEIQVSEISNIFFGEIEDLASKFKFYKIGKVIVSIIEEYKNTGSLNNFEKYVDDYLLDIIKGTKSINYGAEVIFSYLIAKEIEIKNLRLILVGKVNDLSVEFIRERLRGVYV